MFRKVYLRAFSQQISQMERIGRNFMATYWTQNPVQADFGTEMMDLFLRNNRPSFVF